MYTYIYMYFYCAKENFYILIRKLRDKMEVVLMSLYDIFNYLPRVIICKLTNCMFLKKKNQKTYCVCKVFVWLVYISYLLY